MSGVRPAGPAVQQQGAALLSRVSERIGRVLGCVAGIAAVAESAATTARRAGLPVRRADFAGLRPLVADVLRDHASLAVGAGVVLAPGVAADAPRCIEWWWAGPQGRIAPLHVDTDPGSAEFYDYTSTEWYREPERTGRPWVAGPYVDFICTHEYTFTLAVPLRCAGTFIGVAGADILAARVERLVLPELAALGRTAVLATGHGRVVASTTASIPPGAALPQPPPAGQLVPVAGPDAGLLPWTVFSYPTG